MTKLLSITLALCCWAATVSAQTPSIVNGRLEERRAAGTLEREFAALLRMDGARWVGYAVRAQRRNDTDGCWSKGASFRVGTPVKLEGSDDLFVLYRLENGAVERIWISPAECALDLGGLTLHWLTAVPATASLDWLTTFATSAPSRRLENSAVTAMALHGDDSVTNRLITMARDGRESRLRSSALFWLSQRAGDRVAGVIADAIDRDPDTAVKRQAVFALSRLPRDQGVPKLIDVARTNKNQAVRRQAVFWLGQSQDPRALAFFEEVLRTR